MRKIARKISLALILCMLMSMLPASVIAEQIEWLTPTTAAAEPAKPAAPVEPAETTPAAPAVSAKDGSEPAESAKLFTLTSNELAGPSAREAREPYILEEGQVSSGSLAGGSISWRFNTNTRTLTITGKGKMLGFDDFDLPWYEYAEEIVTINVSSGITLEEDLECSFGSYYILSNLTIPGEMTISDFSDSDILTSVTVSGKWEYVRRDEYNAELKILSDVAAASYAPWDALSDSLDNYLSRIEIGAKVTNIAQSAFANMSLVGTPTVYFEGSAEQWTEVMEGGCSGKFGFLVETDKYLTVSCKDGSLIGKCGENVTFVFNGADNSLTIEGEGSLFSDLRWASVQELVTKLVLPENLSTVPRDAFKGMTKLSDSGDKRPPAVIFNGTAEQWKSLGGAANEWGLDIRDKQGNALIVKCIKKDKDDKDVLVGLLGPCGENATFLFEMGEGEGENNLLTINGSGAITDCASYTMPWYCVRGKVEELSIDSSIEKIGDYAFYSCSALEEVIIPGGISSIGLSAFAKCTALNNLTFEGPNEKLEIGNYAFWSCAKLENIGSLEQGLPRDISRIGEAAFRSSGLVYKEGEQQGHIYYEGSQEEWTALKDYSPNVRDRKLLTGETSDDENTYALVHFDCSDDTGREALFHNLTFKKGGPINDDDTDGPDASAAVEIVSSMFENPEDAIGEPVEEDDEDYDDEGNGEDEELVWTWGVAEDTKLKILEDCGLTMEGYTFSGWLCDLDGKVYKPNSTFVMPTENVVFTAQWTLVPLEKDATKIINRIVAEDKKGTTGYPWQVPQGGASSKTELLAWLYNMIPEKLDEILSDTNYSEGYSYRIQVKYFYPAVMGLENMTNGQNGRFAFDLHLTLRDDEDNVFKATASIKDGVIKAIKYNKEKDKKFTVTFNNLEGGSIQNPPEPDSDPDENTTVWKEMLPGRTFRLPVVNHPEGKILDYWECSLESDGAGEDESDAAVTEFINGLTFRSNAQFLMRAANVTFTANWKDAPEITSASTFQAVAAAGAPQPVVNNLRSLVSSELAAGKTASVILESAPVNEKSPEAARLKVASQEDNMSLVDLTLRKTVDGETSAISDTDGNLVSITFPFDGKNAKNVKVYRDHEGEVDVLTEGGSGERISVGDESITIYAGKFSVYAIAYDRKTSDSSEVKPDTPDVGDSSGGDSSSNSNGSNTSGGSGSNAGNTTGSGSTGIDGSGSNSGGQTGGSSNPAPDVGDSNDSAPVEKRFNDVSPDAWYYEAANWAYDHKIARGEGGGRLNPNKLCTRGEMLTFLWRAKGSPEPSGTGKTFSDVAPDAYYAKAVQWAAGMKIVKGEGGKRFNPDAPVTRGEAITFLYRASGTPTEAGSRFNDVPESAYYAEAVEWAVGLDIAKGMGGKSFSPSSPCTRAQALTFLYRSQS